MQVLGLAKWLHHSRTKLLVSPVSWTTDTNTAHDAAIAISVGYTTQQVGMETVCQRFLMPNTGTQSQN